MADKARLKEIMKEVITSENDDEKIVLMAEAETIVDELPEMETVSELQSEVLELKTRNEVISNAYKERFKSSNNIVNDLDKEGEDDKEETKLKLSDLPFYSENANSEFKY